MTAVIARGAAPDAHGAAALLPRLFPDYSGVTLPVNIAPLNFQVREPGDRFRVELHSTRGTPVLLTARSGSIRFPPKAWRALLQANRGEPLYCDISTQTGAGEWRRFATVTNYIAREEIDGFLAYRLLKPLYNSYSHLGIYQRDLSSFEQRPILENERFDRGCLNCHTPLNRQPDTFAFHTRGVPGKEQPMTLVISNEAARVDKTMGYLSWHPSGRLLVFSANQLSLFFHTQGETRDVFDAKSDLGVYRVDSNMVVFPPPISLPERNETWPAWSPDGRFLYFSSVAPLPLEKFRRIRYDLVRVSYDIDGDRWGEPETVVSAQETGLSACQPKISPDGKWLLFTMCGFGNFPIYRADADLYVMDLSTRQYRRLEVNSDQADSWHTWSSNSRWVVFSSKRLDGLFARPFLSYVDERGGFRKPCVLPQEDPAFYDSCLQTFNVPELMRGPVTIDAAALARAILRPGKLLVPKAGPALRSPKTETARTSSRQAVDGPGQSTSGPVPGR